MKKVDLFCDLNLTINYLNESQINELINSTQSDGFNIIGLNKNIPLLSPEYIPPKINHKNNEDILILERVTILINSEKDFKNLKNLRQKFKIDILALKFEDSSILEKFLMRFDHYEDNIISLNISKFQFSTNILKLLSKKNFALEICYKDLLYSDNQKLAFINLFKVFDSHFKNIILSSGATTFFERRAKWELSEFLKGCLERSKYYHSRLFLDCVGIIPVGWVKQAKLRKEGAVSFVESK